MPAASCLPRVAGRPRRARPARWHGGGRGASPRSPQWIRLCGSGRHHGGADALGRAARRRRCARSDRLPGALRPDRSWTRVRHVAAVGVPKARARGIVCAPAAHAVTDPGRHRTPAPGDPARRQRVRPTQGTARAVPRRHEVGAGGRWRATLAAPLLRVSAAAPRLAGLDSQYEGRLRLPLRPAARAVSARGSANPRLPRSLSRHRRAKGHSRQALRW